MSQNIQSPFFFGAGAGQQHEHQQNATPSQQYTAPSFPPTPATNGTPAQAQQMAFQQNATLPVIPGMDLSAVLQNISPQQLALIAAAFQSGQLPLPPPPPTAPTTATAPPPTSALSSAQPPAAVTLAIKPPAVSRTQSEDVDMDKEEGEVEEGEVDDSNTTREFISAPLKAQKVRRPVPPAKLNPPRHAKDNARVAISTAATKETAVTTFIRQMHDAGYTFDQLAKEVSSPKALRAVYQRLGIPVNPTDVTAKAAPQNGAPAPASNVRKSSLPKVLPPASAQTDEKRAAFLAKLQAAKNKKPQTSTASPTQPKPVVLPPVVAAATVPPEPPVQAKPASPAPTVPTTVPAKPKVKTDLVIQRLAALRAQQAAKAKETAGASDKAGSSSPGTAQSFAENGAQQPSAHSGLGTGLVEAAALAARSEVALSSSPVPVPRPASIPQATAAASSASPTMNGGFFLPGLPGLPGLRPSGMPASPAAHRPASTPQLSQAALPDAQSTAQAQARPDSSLSRNASNSLIEAQINGRPQRPSGFGSTSAEEPFIITDSDEESDDDMEITDSLGHKADRHSVQKNLTRAAGSNKGPATTDSAHRSSLLSAPGTPLTPGGDAYQLKMQELDELKRQIALKEQSRKSKPVPGNVPSGNSTPLSEGVKLLQEPTTRDDVGSSSTGVNDNVPEAAISDVQPQPDLTFAVPQAEPSTSAPNDDEEDEDDFDDAGLYDEDAGVELPTNMNERKVGSQATTITASTQSDDTPAANDDVPSGYGEAQGDDDFDMEQNTQEPLIAGHQDPALHQEVNATSYVHTSAQQEQDADEVDDDDLDDIYGPPSTSQNLHIPPEPSNHVATSREMEAERESESDADDAMDTSDDSSSGSEEDDEDSEESSSPGSEAGQEDAISISDDSPKADQTAADAHDTEMSVDDDLAPELQPSEEEPGVPFEELPKPRTAFTSYHSPLSLFKDFRFHPEFLHEVPGGFKSLTYSHKIDPNKTFCPYQTTGGICNDKNCPHQHFEALGLSDNELLMLMGVQKVPDKSPEGDKKWKAGLSKVVAELRKKGTAKDVAAISQAIAEYRREFLGDPTRTLVFD